MKIKKLFNADVLMENFTNKVMLEKITVPNANVSIYVEHSIYFAESLTVYKDAVGTETYAESAHYEMAEMDSIATEQSNKDCYRAVRFLSPDIKEAWVSYHSYGDIICAETFNEFVDSINTVTSDTLAIKEAAKKLHADFNVHEKNEKAHGASDGVFPNKIALRTASGTLKAADPKEDSDLVTKKSLNEKAQEIGIKTDEKIDNVKSEISEMSREINERLKAKKEVIGKKDFYPENYTPDENDQSTINPEIEASAEVALSVHVSETKKHHNVIRNSRGSIVVPEPESDNEAANKKSVVDAVNVRIEQIDDKINAAINLKGYTENINWENDIETRMRNDTLDFQGSRIYKKYYAIRSLLGDLKAGTRKTNSVPALPNNAQVIFFNGTAIKRGYSQRSVPLFCIPEFKIYSEGRHVYYDITSDLSALYDFIFIEVSYVK